MNPLFDHIRNLIKKSGPMPLSSYMELALLHPEYGYYKKGDPLGAAGDFITAPEISQMFGELVGLCLAEVWKSASKPDPFVLCELGPGRGTLMQDALRATTKIPGFHQAMDLCLIESNVTLREKQEEKLASHHPRYVDDLESLPPQPLFLIANEFFDALPVRQFERAFDGWRERLVTVDGEELEFILSPPDPAFMFLIPPNVREAVVGTVHEASLPSLALGKQIAQHIAKHGGAALIIDYGHTAHPGKGTLQAASKHRHAEVLEHPGEVDLTAHVDFMAVKHIAEGQGAVVFGPVPQGEFLQTLGIEMRAMQLKHNATPEQEKTVDEAVRRLTDLAEMGALFKVMAITSPHMFEMPGF